MRAAFYKCAAAKKKKTCDKKSVRKQWPEDLVVNQTMRLVKDDAAMESIIAKVMELQARIAEEKLAKPKVTEEFIRFWLLRFRKLDMSLKDQRQALVDTFINAIYLYDDKVLITFNYKEGTQTVTFGEATEVASEGNGSDLDCFTAPRKCREIERFHGFFVL